jgi:hypothetical protein
MNKFTDLNKLELQILHDNLIAYKRGCFETMEMFINMHNRAIELYDKTISECEEALKKFEETTE